MHWTAHRLNKLVTIDGKNWSGEKGILRRWTSSTNNSTKLPEVAESE